MSDNSISIGQLFKWFVIEDTREFTTVFGSYRFALFPIVLSVFAVFLGFSATIIQVTSTTLGFGYFTLVILFGVQVGLVGFEAKDRLSNIFGDGSRLVYASRTLPISQRRIVSIFLLKDMFMYSILFLLPITLGGFVGLYFSPVKVLEIQVFELNTIGAVYGATIASFVLGSAIGFVSTTLSFSNRLIWGLIILLAIVVYSSLQYISTVATVVLDTSLESYALFSVVSAIGLVAFGQYNMSNPAIRSTPTQYENSIDSIANGLPRTSTVTQQLISKTVLDIQRSAGGFWKILLSSGIIAFVGLFMYAFIDTFFVTAEVMELSLAAILSLVSYPIYTNLFRYDSVTTYSYLPIDTRTIFIAKYSAFAIMMSIIGIGVYTPIILTQTEFSPVLFVYGLILYCSLSVYQLAALRVFAKDEPIRFLFDGLSFTKFSLTIILALIPSLILGLYANYIDVYYITIGVGLLSLYGISGVLIVYYLDG